MNYIESPYKTIILIGPPSFNPAQSDPDEDPSPVDVSRAESEKRGDSFRARM